jgi:hypothetical protein
MEDTKREAIIAMITTIVVIITGMVITTAITMKNTIATVKATVKATRGRTVANANTSEIRETTLGTQGA